MSAKKNPFKPGPDFNLTRQFEILKSDPRQAAIFQLDAQFGDYDPDGDEAAAEKARAELAAEKEADTALRHIALNEALAAKTDAWEKPELVVHRASIFFDFLKNGTDPWGPKKEEAGPNTSSAGSIDDAVTKSDVEGNLAASGCVTLGSPDGPPAALALPASGTESEPVTPVETVVANGAA